MKNFIARSVLSVFLFGFNIASATTHLVSTNEPKYADLLAASQLVKCDGYTCKNLSTGEVNYIELVEEPIHGYMITFDRYFDTETINLHKAKLMEHYLGE